MDQKTPPNRQVRSLPVTFYSMGVSLGLLLFLLQGCSRSVSPELFEDTTIEDRRTISQGETTREYLIRVPGSYNNQSEPRALIINMHGYGGDAMSYRAYVGEKTDLHLLADQREFIVAYPDAFIRKGGGEPYWQPGDNGEMDIALNDVYFIDRVLNDIKANYSIDERRVFAFGFSNGGMMAYSLGCNSGDIFAAVGGMATTMIPEECNIYHTPSIIAFHGTDDTVLPYNGNAVWQAVPDVMRFWVDHNGLSRQDMEITEFNNNTIQLEQYSGEQSTVSLYTFEGGEHVWFTELIDGMSPSEVLWEFLENIQL